jgi:hypothetical protein
LAKEEKAMDFQLIPVQLHEQSLEKFDPKEQVPSEYSYTAIAIADNGRYYYWAKGFSLEIADWEYRNVKLNPKLYYFSTALKLHIRIQKLVESHAKSI